VYERAVVASRKEDVVATAQYEPFLRGVLVGKYGVEVGRRVKFNDARGEFVYVKTIQIPKRVVYQSCNHLQKVCFALFLQGSKL
jgi:hypothetical protein